MRTGKIVQIRFIDMFPDKNDNNDKNGSKPSRGYIGLGRVEECQQRMSSF
jgi:Ribonuclease G/E